MALDRFMGSEALFEKFLNMFLKDKSMSLLLESLDKNDIQEAFLQAHTMKGVVSNLEISSLSEILVPLTDELRENKTEHIKEKVDELNIRYNAICDLIQSGNS